MKRVLLLMKSESYRAEDFVAAAARLGVDLVVGSDEPNILASLSAGRALHLDFGAGEASTEKIVAFHRDRPLDAVVPAEDEGTVLAARAAAALGLAGNPEESVVSGRDKHVFREITRAAGLKTPWFKRYRLQEEPAAIAAEVVFPCVLKPLFLSGSRGVIRADRPAEFVAAFRRIGAILARPEVRAQGGELADWLLVESYLPGAEVAVEGILRQGRLHPLVFFDKPDPLEGPFFEETLYVTPSSHPEALQRRVLAVAADGARALGLRTGPIHAELRLGGGEPVLLEIAARSIGGRCSRVLRFGSGISLEEIILGTALGMVPAEQAREEAAAGVMMIPIPAAGLLTGVAGLEKARQTPGVEGVEITIPAGQPVVPLPEGRRYLGFIYAKGETPGQVETALREAQRRLRFDIRPVEPSAAAGAH